MVLRLAELRAHGRAAGHREVAVRDDGPQRAELSSRRRHGGLPRAAGGAVRGFRLRLHRPVAAAGPGPHLPVQYQSAGAERRCAGHDHDAAQVSGVTIALIGRPQTHPVRRTELNARRQSIFTCAGLNAARTG